MFKNYLFFLIFSKTFRVSERVIGCFLNSFLTAVLATALLKASIFFGAGGTTALVSVEAGGTPALVSGGYADSVGVYGGDVGE